VIGSALLWIWVWTLGSVLSLLSIVLYIPFNPLTDPRRVVHHWLSQSWGRGVMWMLPGITIEAQGFEHLLKGPCILCPNHNSVSDIIMLLAALPRFKFVAKTTNFLSPPIGWHLFLSGYIRAGAGAEGDSERVQQQCVKWLKAGERVLWFAEGTRSIDGKVQRFRKGAFAIAKHAGVPIVPVALTGTRQVIAKKSLRYHFHVRVQITCLEPMAVEGELKEAAAKCRELVAAQVARQEATAQPPPTW
jgi:1-acyl-sn-glycerol-3-phosphate acyltransferase